MTVSAVTERIGYKSEVSFSKAFQAAPRHAPERVPRSLVAGCLTTCAPDDLRFGGEEALLDDGMDPPVAIHDLRNAVIHRHRHKRNRLVLRKTRGGHEGVPHLAEGVAHGEIHRRLRVDVALRLGAELLQVLRITEALQHP